jgi:hypothetical protein
VKVGVKLKKKHKISPAALKKKTVSKSKEVKPLLNLAEYSKEVSGLKKGCFVNDGNDEGIVCD